MDMEILSPIKVRLDVVDLDKHIPSLKFGIKIEVKKFSYDIKVNSQVWIECQCFDDFINNMQKGEIAILRDMNSLFEFRVNSAQGWFEWTCAKEGLDGFITLAQGREALTEQSARVLYEAFISFPKWW